MTEGGITIADIITSLEEASSHTDGRPRNFCLLRPCSVSNLIELDAALVRQAIQQIGKVIQCLQCGITSPEDHPVEILLLQIFQQHAMNAGYTQRIP